ncbi:MAG: c-type cytochrome [Phycisphaerales bacterium JB039]
MVQWASMTLANAGMVENLWFGGKAWTSNGREASDLFGFIWWVSVVSFVLLIGLTVTFMIKYRRKPGVPAPRSASHNTPLELAWSIIPLIVMFWMFFEGFRIFISQQVAPTGGPTLNLTAQRWSWTLEYPNGAQTDMYAKSYTPAGEDQSVLAANQEMPIFYVPEDVPILLRMVSTDVIHSFWVPDFRLKADVFPNRYTSYWFQADPLGDEAQTMRARDDKHIDRDYPYRDHVIFCAEYCGDLHSEMYGVLRVVPNDVYQAKIAAWGQPSGSLAERGQIVARRRGCLTCHSVDGSPNTGPTWENLYGYQHDYTDGSTIMADANHIRESILNPGVKVRQGYPNQMASFQGIVSEQEITALIAYIGTLSDETSAAELEEFNIDPDAAPVEGGAGEGGADAGAGGQAEGESEGQ